MLWPVYIPQKSGRSDTRREAIVAQQLPKNRLTQNTAKHPRLTAVLLIMLDSLVPVFFGMALGYLEAGRATSITSMLPNSTRS